MAKKLDYILQLADNASVMGHRLGEWCGHGPILEQDIAMTNTALDHIGRARSLYKYAADLFNQMMLSERKNYFSSVALLNEVNTGIVADEDDMAFLRDSWDFRNVLLVEQPNGDWAFTVARSFYFDVFNYYFFTELKGSTDTTIAAIAEKSLKEVTYHKRWSSEWVIRLGDGTEESHKRMQDAIDTLWTFTGELFVMNDTDKEMLHAGIAPDLNKINTLWLETINSILKEATLNVPTNNWVRRGGKEGNHSEHLGYILAEMQYMQRTYPNMDW